MAEELDPKPAPDALRDFTAIVDSLKTKIASLEARAVQLEAQLLFTESALMSCIDRERRLSAEQDELRNEIHSKVLGRFSTE